MQKVYYIYQITNLVNGKIYVGVHQTHNMKDGYMGSGKLLLKAYAKYGIHNFRKDILFFCNSEEELFQQEAVIVDSEFIKRKDVYNLTEGGNGGGEKSRLGGLVGGKVSFLKQTGYHSPATKRRAIQSLLKNKVSIHEKLKQENKGVYNREVRLKASRNANNPISRKKQSETLKKNLHGVGEKNSQFGSQWITNGIENKKILKGSLIPEGFQKGRHIKPS